MDEKIMNKYESIMILVPDIEEKRKEEILDKIRNVIMNYSTKDKEIVVEEMGKKRLAYEIKNNKEGYYIVINFTCEPEAIKELERYYRITDEVLKFLTISKQED